MECTTKTVHEMCKYEPFRYIMLQYYDNSDRGYTHDENQR